MVIQTCLAALIAFQSSYEFSHTKGWVFYNFPDFGYPLKVHTWASNDKELIKFFISENPNLVPKDNTRTLDKGICMEESLPYFYYRFSMGKK